MPLTVPLFIIPTRSWFGLVRSTSRDKKPLGYNLLQVLNRMLHLTLRSTFSNQEGFHGEGAKQRVHVKMCKCTA